MTFTASSGDAGRRLDQFLAAQLPALSRSQIQRLIHDGHVQVSRGRAKPALALDEGVEVQIEIPPASPPTPAPEALPLAVLYDDEDLVVIDKPAGMVVHPGAGHASGTLVNALLHHVRGLSGIGGTERPGIVHRLDRGTSGVMVIAKHDRSHRALARQFHDREVDKEYVALVWGTVKAGDRLDRPIGRDPRHRQKMSSRARRPRAAVTDILHVEPLPGLSLIRVKIGTGRTHQIRVHLSESGHPVVGDPLYGGIRKHLPGRLARLASVARPFLHAARLGFTHPSTGARLTFDAPLPEDLKAVIGTLA